MTEETTAETQEATETETKTENTVPYERFQQANQKAREASDRAKALEKSIGELRTAMEARENEGLPELDRMRKDMERLSKRAEEAEAKAAEADTRLARSAKERWVVAAAKDFNDPSDAVAFVDFDGIEDSKDAERAVRAIAKARGYLLKTEEPRLPGKVLENGQAVAQKTYNGPDFEAEAEMLAGGLKQFATKQ